MRVKLSEEHEPESSDDENTPRENYAAKVEAIFSQLTGVASPISGPGLFDDQNSENLDAKTVE